MKFLANFSRIVLGAYLIFSGFLKVVDPYGTALKLKEYFEVFAVDLPSFGNIFGILAESSVNLSLLFCCLELVIGVALLFGFKLKITAWGALLLISFFTFLTFYSAYFNRVTDCGCFGEFMKLKPWASFWKNVVTLFFVGVIFLYRKNFKYYPSGTPALLLSIIIALGIGIYSLTFLPVIDMLPYAVGKSIPQQMQRHEIKPLIEYIFLDKTSNQPVVTQEYLLDTAKYKYETSRILNEDEITPVITDFNLSDTSGAERLEAALEGRKIILILRNTEEIGKIDFKPYRELVEKIKKNRITPIILTAEMDIAGYLSENKLNYAYYFADEKMLKTMARNTPVIYLLEDGVVLGKWSFNRIPTETQIRKLIK